MIAISEDLLPVSTTNIIRLCNKNGNEREKIIHIRRIRNRSRYIEMPRDALIQSYNLVLEKNRQMEHNIKYVKQRSELFENLIGWYP